MNTLAKPVAETSRIDTLDTDITTLISSVETIQTTTKNLDDSLEKLDGILGIPDTIYSDLNKLTEAITTVEGLMNVVSVIPQLRTEAKDLIKALKLIGKPITTAKNTLKPYSDDIKPVRDKLEKIEKKVSTFNKKVGELKKDLLKLRGQFERADNCISDLPDGKVKDELLLNLNELAGVVDVPVKRINKQISTIDSTLQKIVTMIDKRIDAQVAILVDIEKEVSDLGKVLNRLLSPLRELRSLLEKEFRFAIYYPCFKHKGVCEYDIRVSGAMIVKGANKIENYIEKKLRGIILKAAQEFGIKKIVKQLMSDYDHAFHIIAKKLHLDIDIKIPGMDQLDGAVTEIQKSVKTILGQFKLDLSSLEKGVGKIEDAYTKANTIYTDCTKCPHS